MVSFFAVMRSPKALISLSNSTLVLAAAFLYASSASLNSLVLSVASSVLFTKYSITDVTATIAAPTTVVIIKPLRAILKAVAEYAPLFKAALKTRVNAADRLALSPNKSIAAPPAFERNVKMPCWIFRALSVLTKLVILIAVIPNCEVKLSIGIAPPTNPATTSVIAPNWFFSICVVALPVLLISL